MEKYIKKRIVNNSYKMARKNIILICTFILSIIMIISLSSANLGTFKQNTCVNIRVLGNCTINLNEVTSISDTYKINTSMDNLAGQTYNYTFCNTSSLGIYTYSWSGTCLNCASDNCGNKFEITPYGYTNTGSTTAIYLFFLISCTIILFYSFKVMTISTNTIDYKEYYHINKSSKIKYYIKLLKDKIWILGTFGVYLSIVIILSAFAQLTYSVGMSEISQSILPVITVLFWGLIPFVLFWFIYILVYFYETTLEITKYQFGGLKK